MLFLPLAGALFAQSRYDLLLKDGYVIDPKNRTSAVRDVAIRDGKVAAVSPEIPASQARKVVYVGSLYVTPGLVDIHAHVFTGDNDGMLAGGNWSIFPDTFAFRTGVTTVVDAGSSGRRNFAQFKRTVIDRARTRVLVFLNILGAGMPGDELAELLGAPAAMVTCGCASAITMGTVACVAGGDPEKLGRLPDTTGMKNEIVQQKSHRGGYEQQMLLVGTKIIWVETREDLDRAINERTAMMFFYNEMEPEGKIGRHEWIRVGKERGVPTFNDAASDTPPVERLSQYVREGFDLVAFSGGKALLGPQCSGLLMGRKDLIEAALPGMNPYSSIGRGMKVGKEEMVGLLAAVERYLKVDHDREMKELEARVQDMIGAIAKIRGLTAERHMPPIANHVPHVRLTWNEDDIKLQAGEVVRRLIEGNPPIAISMLGERLLQISVWMMRPGEHLVVSKRLHEIFTGA
jgi:L-seryl-tRNA(Ser) seleniumtransferase